MNAFVLSATVMLRCTKLVLSNRAMKPLTHRSTNVVRVSSILGNGGTSSTAVNELTSSPCGSSKEPKEDYTIQHYKSQIKNIPNTYQNTMNSF
jgi:hypothetical protein